jgi:hypothetical protein
MAISAIYVQLLVSASIMISLNTVSQGRSGLQATEIIFGHVHGILSTEVVFGPAFDIPCGFLCRNEVFGLVFTLIQSFFFFFNLGLRGIFKIIIVCYYHINLLKKQRPKFS